MSELKSIKFSDIYIGRDAAWLAGIPSSLDPCPVPECNLEEVRNLRAACEDVYSKINKEDFALSFNGTQYRASIIRSVSEMVFVLRRFPERIPAIETLGLHPSIIEKLTRQGLTGLIVVAGAFGQGKTTTASSVVVARLSKLGGVAVTIEDPPEMPLHGQHGEGVCYQTWVGQGEFANACRKAARWAPSIIFLGEIRDSETAIEALRASINGRLVICTAHADNPIMAVERIYSLASAGFSSSEDVSSLLAAGLTYILHQKLESHGDRKQVLMESLWLNGDDAHGIRATIAAKKFSQLTSAMQMQKNRMLLSSHPR